MNWRFCYIDGCSNYRQLSVSFWYKRAGGQSSVQGLFNNGDYATEPSVLITSQPDSIGVRLVTQSNSISRDDIQVIHISFVRPSSRSSVRSLVLFICLLYVCILLYLHICIFVYLYICIFVYLYVCIFVYLYICIFVYLHICIFAYL